MDVQSPETPGFLSLRLDVYSPPQVLQIHGRLCHLVLAFLIMEKLQTEGPLCSADITLLHRSYGPIRHPLAVDRFPGCAGYTIYLAPVISPRDEEGFSSCLACPCHRAVAFTPPRSRCRVGQISASHAAFALQLQARPSDPLIFEATCAFTFVT